MPCDSDADAHSWINRVIAGTRVGELRLPDWLIASHSRFRETVLDPRYPCYFGSSAEGRGELYYAYVERGQLEHLPQTLSTFIAVASTQTNQRNNLAVFFQPEPKPLTHDRYRAMFWDCLQFLHDHDPSPAPRAQMLQPSDALWEFPFDGAQFFVVGISPSYVRRHSRNLGPGMLMLFQPRNVFVDDVTGRPISQTSRAIVRKRLAEWDEIPAHPDLNVYGDPANREWKQYFLPDDQQAGQSECTLVISSLEDRQVESERIAAREGVPEPVSSDACPVR